MPTTPSNQPELTAFEREARENEAKAKKEHDERTQSDSERKQLESERKARLEHQQKLFAGVRRPDAENRMGGMAGKFAHLAELQPESLAGMVITQYMVLIFRVLLGCAYREECALFDQAKKVGLAYDGTQTIYKMGPDRSLDFKSPYQAGEEIPKAVIFANGYIPKPTVANAFQNEFFMFIEQQGGAEILGDKILAKLYGILKAEHMKQQGSAPSGGITREEQMIADASRRQQAAPKPRGGGQK